jgi:outer membrane protein TolC
VLPVVLAAAPSPDDLAAPRPGAVAAANERAAAARERARPLSSLYGPRVDFEYIHQLWDHTNPVSTSQRKSGWQVVARWDFPVGGELQARLAEQEQRALAAQAESERVLLGIHTDLDEIAPRIDNLRRAVDQLDGQIGRYDMLVRAGELQFEAGRRSLSQLAQLHESRFNAQQRRSELANRLTLAQLRQLTLTGGLLAAFDLPPQ